MSKKQDNILKNLKSPGFKLPDGYMDALESEMIKKVMMDNSKSDESDRNNLSIISNNTLEPAKKHSGFKVPFGYFEEVEDSILKPDSPKTEASKVYKLRLISLSIAASILLFFGIKFNNIGNSSIDHVVLQNGEITEWLDEGLVSFDTYEIAEAFSDIELEQSLYEDEEVNDYLDFMDIESLIIEN